MIEMEAVYSYCRMWRMLGAALIGLSMLAYFLRPPK